MNRSIRYGTAAALVMLHGSAAAQTAPPEPAAPAPAVVAPPPRALPAPPPQAPPAPLPQAPPAPVPSGWPPQRYIDLGALSLTLGAFTGATVLVCGFTLGPGVNRDACQVTLGGLALAMAVTSIPLFVAGARKPLPVTVVAGARRIAVELTF